MPDHALAELLRWYVEAGADEAIGEMPVDRFAPPPRSDSLRSEPPPARAEAPPAPPSSPAGRTAAAAVQAIAAPALASSVASSARALADSCNSLEELEAAVRGFEGCALKATATNTVFGEGAAGAPVMVIGEAPGADEDRIGRPFVGRSGQLLDRMLASIGLAREHSAYIANVLYWRPPGNRKPAPAEIAACLPFVLRQIALVDPALLMLCGGTATSALLGTSEGITRLRGRWFELAVPGHERPLPVLATFHPSYLLRTPGSKKDAWRDLISVQAKLEDLQVSLSGPQERPA